MASNAVIENGKVMNAGFTTESTFATEDANAKTKEVKASSGMDKNAFMKILVAQMKYQDPMQPTSNTEYISQYAQFSQVESLSNISNTMELQRASQLVGQYVTIDNSAVGGEGAEVNGMVDSVNYSGSKVYLTVNGQTYDLENLKSVDDGRYTDAKTIVQQIKNEVDKFGYIEDIQEADADKINAVYKKYENLTDYQRKFLDANYETIIKNYKAQLDDVVAIAEAKREFDANVAKGQEGLIEVDETPHPSPAVTPSPQGEGTDTSGDPDLTDEAIVNVVPESGDDDT